MADRATVVERRTAETAIRARVDLDGGPHAEVETGVPRFDELVRLFAVEAGITLELSAQGDLHIDPHHTIEDCGIVLGDAIRQALGAKAGVTRAASAHRIVDDASALAVIDLSGRPYAVLDLAIFGLTIGGFDSDLLRHSLESFSFALRANLHIRVESGQSDERKAEAAFRAFGAALAGAIVIDERRAGDIPSTKGVI